MSVSAEYRDQAGQLLWEENPYPYKRKWRIGQLVSPPPFGTIGGPQYCIVQNNFKGTFDDGKISYVVKLQKKRS